MNGTHEKSWVFFCLCRRLPETVNDAAVQVIILSNITFFTRKTNLFYLELSKILLYYHNIDPGAAASRLQVKLLKMSELTLQYRAACSACGTGGHVSLA